MRRGARIEYGRPSAGHGHSIEDGLSEEVGDCTSIFLFEFQPGHLGKRVNVAMLRAESAATIVNFVVGELRV